MLQITLDVYSGRPNPVVQLGEGESRSLLRDLAGSPTLITDTEAGRAGSLGFRGFRVERLADEDSADAALPSSFYLSARSLASAARGQDVAERLLGSITRSAAGTEQPLDAELPEYVLSQIASSGPESAVDGGTPGDNTESAATTCMIELGGFNPSFWNDDANTRYNNNCYNYASNWRTNTFAQPGKGCGNMYSVITCQEVTRAALCDGMHRRFDCFPDAERPRWLVALVVAPGAAFNDFHWYRKQSGNFWGHKPGGTAARNVDNSGILITNPETANRGPYTQFCGYFYGCNTQRQRIR